LVPTLGLCVALLALWVPGILKAGTLTGTFSSIAAGSNVNLTMSGKLDWVHWGLYTDTSVDRKSCATPMISDFALVSNNAADCTNCFLTQYQYSDNANGYTWYDGAPFSAVTNSTTGIWAYNFPVPVGAGFQITVPADLTQRTLEVFVGAYAAVGQLRASLSDASAPDFVSGSLPNQTVNNLGSGPSGVFSLNYSANTDGQKLTVTWVVATPRGLATEANVTLQAATLTAAGVDNPPFVMVTNPVANSTFPEPATITLEANAQDFDGTVTNVAFYAGGTKLGESAAGPYNFTWSNVPRGRYKLTAYATDNLGVTSCAPPVQIFVYGTGGQQTGNIAAPAATVDLTSDGTADWTHWGLVTAASFDYKALVQRKISNFVVRGTHAVENFGDNPTAFSWIDGTPTLSTNATTTGVFITGVTNGFMLTAPADMQPRHLNVYVGGYGAQGEFQAYLSDLSGPPYTDNSISNVYNTSSAVYTIDYSAASAGQQLIVVYHAVNSFDLAYGNVNLQAATLEGGPAEALPVYLSNPVESGNDFIFSFLTQSNFNYAIEETTSLPSTNWAIVTNISGTGATISVTNQYGITGKKFYRVRTY
jgi:hypothetical protein